MVSEPRAPIIEIRAATKTYPGGPQALKGVDCTIHSGEGVVLLGSNGCGKSTLLRALIGLERHDGGSIRVDGVDLEQTRSSQLRALRSRVGMVFQKFQLMPGMSAFQNVLFGALGRRSILQLTTMTARKDDREEAMRSLDRVGLADLAAQRVGTMSGGQQQRVAVARMLMQRPKIVLADEPVASLDPRAGIEIMDLLWTIVKEDKLTVICTLHQLDLALTYAERIIGMQSGRVVIDDRVSDLDHATLHSLYQRPDANGGVR